MTKEDKELFFKSLENYWLSNQPIKDFYRNIVKSYNNWVDWYNNVYLGKENFENYRDINWSRGIIYFGIEEEKTK